LDLETGAFARGGGEATARGQTLEVDRRSGADILPIRSLCSYALSTTSSAALRREFATSSSKQRPRRVPKPYLRLVAFNPNRRRAVQKHEITKVADCRGSFDTTNGRGWFLAGTNNEMERYNEVN
jgi:hypothetical protein